jgi:hypothetical protein
VNVVTQVTLDHTRVAHHHSFFCTILS